MRKRETTNKREMDSPTIRIVPDLESIERNRRIDFLLEGRETTNKREMDGPTIRIVSDLESIERNRRIDFLLEGSDLTIDYLSISNNSYEIGFVTGEIKSIDIPQAIRKSTIDGIILDLKSGKIEKGKEHNYREFKEIYLKNLVGKWDFASSKVTTKEINDVINEIKESNASYGITPEDISSVSRFDSNSQEVLDYSIFNSTDVEGPKLPELPEINGGQYIGIAGIAGGIFGGVLAVAFAGLGYFVWHGKNREGSYRSAANQGIKKRKGV